MKKAAKGSPALAKQAEESRNPEVVDEGSVVMRRDKKEASKPYVDRANERRNNRADAKDEARKRHAKKTGGNLFPEVKPEEGQIVMATKTNRVGSHMFMAQFHDGAFYSNPNGTYSMLEGDIDSWTILPGDK
jgi:hypothetical protein